jgi:hypothetical protein
MGSVEGMVLVKNARPETRANVDATTVEIIERAVVMTE